ncbi:T9SS type A sorting domain-containing protein [Rasiella sp. SM2506]|uniref:T9SS type A sorting domain-containing protein n=1 Tax=Rasiella sp. SM2506 TaxID=3423914 RepID=UPI003D7AA9CE
MKTQLFIVSILLLVSNIGSSQCTVDSFVQDNYLTDAWTMVFREFANDPTHPDYNVPLLDVENTLPYLEKISAVYNLVATNPVADSIFNKFEIHVNQRHPEDIAFGELFFEVGENVSWVQDFIDTGISGVPALDQLMADYQFTITSISIVDPPGNFSFKINSTIPYLNHFALLDDFSNVDDIESVSPGQGAGFNYNGIPFQINGEDVVATNIISNSEGLKFSLHVDFCGTTCEISKGWDVFISKDCSQVTIEEILILNNPDFTKTTFNIYPNPVNEKLIVKAKNASITAVTIFSATGTIISSNNHYSESIDVSSLSAGLYFIEFVSSEGQKYIYKFLKK